MKVAAYQAPLLPSGSMDSIRLIRERIGWCESEGVELLCCPEAILGGLADYAEDPSRIAIATGRGALEWVLAPLASPRVTTIIGFTEIDLGGRLFNSAAVFHQGAVLGIYRKRQPAIRRSVYQAGRDLPVFEVGGLRFGIQICLDTNDPEPARTLARAGAAALFFPTNNGLPHGRADETLTIDARNIDIARAVENDVYVIRADVSGRNDALLSYGSSGIVDPEGMVLQSGRTLSEDILVVEIARGGRGL